MSLFLHRSGLTGVKPTEYLSDLVPGASFLWSPRQALSREAFAKNDFLTVRESGDNNEEDFTRNQVNALNLTNFTGANDGRIVAGFDASGNGNHPTQATAGDQPWIVDGGVLLPAAEFRGAQFLQVPSTDDMRGKPLNVCLWVRSSASQTNNSTPLGYGIVSGEVNWRFQFVDGTGFCFEIFDGAIMRSSDSGGIFTTNDTWFFYTGKIFFNGTDATVEIYRDGNLINSTTANRNLPNQAGDLFVGAENNRRFFNGDLAFVGIWPRDLTTAEIEIIKNATDPTK